MLTYQCSRFTFLLSRRTIDRIHLGPESLWDFGDGMTSTLPSPTHTYTATGVYTVALTVSGPGGSDTETKAEYIKVNYGVYYLPIIMKDSD